MSRFALAALALALAGAGCSEAPQARTFGDAALPTVVGAQTVVLAHCPTSRCVTVYVAPWCPYCRAAAPLIEAMREHLKTRDVTLRVVVGLDKPERNAEYARGFGPDTLVDDNQTLQISGVPHFLVSDAQGRIVRDVSGAPMPTSPPPWGPDVLEQVEGQIGI